MLRAVGMTAARSGGWSARRPSSRRSSGRAGDHRRPRARGGAHLRAGRRGPDVRHPGRRPRRPGDRRRPGRRARGGAPRPPRLAAERARRARLRVGRPLGPGRRPGAPSGAAPSRAPARCGRRRCRRRQDLPPGARRGKLGARCARGRSSCGPGCRGTRGRRGPRRGPFRAPAARTVGLRRPLHRTFRGVVGSPGSLRIGPLWLAFGGQAAARAAPRHCAIWAGGRCPRSCVPDTPPPCGSPPRTGGSRGGPTARRPASPGGACPPRCATRSTRSPCAPAARRAPTRQHRRRAARHLLVGRHRVHPRAPVRPGRGVGRRGAASAPDDLSLGAGRCR
jgi:hypothetical protein